MIAATLAALVPAGAEAACRLALLLALDVSSSVDEAEYRLQRDGLAAALTSPDVQGAILQQGGGVALAVYEWSGRRQSVVVQDWVLLHSAGDIAAVAARLQRVQRSYRRFPTALGYALGFGATLMQEAPPCERQVIDVSGDGITNDGFWPGLAYKHFPFERITVNALAVLGADPSVVDHYEFEVLHGPGAFIETAEGYEGFERAMIRKLYREIQNRVVGGLPYVRPGPG
ncbi:DUF1194 domain-containing protein [Mameliella sp.]|uniref:DUF1194 domain-containing protein n=1 Tax=Mameliella sp. TaxID=1924940 RepID=UPI003B5148A3